MSSQPTHQKNGALITQLAAAPEALRQLGFTERPPRPPRWDFGQEVFIVPSYYQYVGRRPLVIDTAYPSQSQSQTD